MTAATVFIDIYMSLCVCALCVCTCMCLLWYSALHSPDAQDCLQIASMGSRCVEENERGRGERKKRRWAKVKRLWCFFIFTFPWICPRVEVGFVEIQYSFAYAVSWGCSPEHKGCVLKSAISIFQGSRKKYRWDYAAVQYHLSLSLSGTLWSDYVG